MGEAVFGKAVFGKAVLGKAVLGKGSSRYNICILPYKLYPYQTAESSAYRTSQEIGQSRCMAATLETIPDEFQGEYDAAIKWNGTMKLIVTPHFITWKATNILLHDITISGHNIKFTVFVANQQSEWVRGVVGLSETFNITFAGARFTGNFQRQGEGGLGIEGARRETAKQAVSRLPLARQLSGSSVECPICMEEFSNESRPAIETRCGHHFCHSCIVSACKIAPPASEGSCPLCRATVTLEGLKRATV